MGLFDWLTGGIPNAKNLAWVASMGGRLEGGTGWGDHATIVLGDARVCYHTWTTGSGKNRTTHYRTFFIAPLPYSMGTVEATPQGCSWFSTKRPHDFDTFSVVHSGDPLLAAVLEDVRTVARNLKPARIEVSLNGLFIQVNRHLVKQEMLGPFIQNGLWLHPRVTAAKQEDQGRDEKYFGSLALPGRSRLIRGPGWAPVSLSLDAITGPARLELNPPYALKSYLLPPIEQSRWALPQGLVFEAPLKSAATLKVFTQRFWHALPKLFGYQDLTVGDGAFDKQFVVKSNQERFARGFLSRDICRTILQLRQLAGDTFVMDLTLRSLHLKFGAYYAGRAELEAVIAGGLTLLERFASVTGLSAGVKFEAVEAATGVCQVCGAAMEKAVYCDRCRTPHHAECWQYLGRCSTYACSGSSAQ